MDALPDWLALRAYEPGPLFVRIRRGGHLVAARLTPQAVYHIRQNRATEARVASFTSRDLRRSFAGDLLDAGVDLPMV